MFKIQRKQCRTCIYHKASPLDIEQLEARVRDNYGGFKGHRVCHHSKDACCRGFWNRHKWEFQAGQIAQRLGLVTYVDEDTLVSKYTFADKLRKKIQYHRRMARIHKRFPEKREYQEKWLAATEKELKQYLEEQ